MPRLIALRYPNRPMAARLNQIWDRGDAVLPLSPLLTDRELHALVSALRPHRLEEPAGATDLPDGVAVDEGVAAVIATSGVSGEPKGVELTHTALRSSASAYTGRLGSPAGARWLCCLPLSHIGGLGIIYRSRVSGVPPVVHDRFDPAAVAGEAGAGLVSLVPTTLLRLLDAGIDLSRYFAVLVGGAGLAPEQARRARRAGVRLVQTYGMTETCGACNFDGYPLEGVQIRLDQEQIMVRGPMLMRAYRLQPELTAQALRDGWLHTQDLGRITPEGRLEVLGRWDEVVITGGEKVAVTEVEDLLRQHPGVADVAVAGIPDPQWGQVVAALVVARGPAPTQQQIKAQLAGKAAAFKVPKRVVIAAEIPRTPTGKIRRAAVRDLLSEQTQAP